MSPDSAISTENPCESRKGCPTINEAVMPAIEPLRVDSEEVLFWAMEAALSWQAEVRTDDGPSVLDRCVLASLVSKGNDYDLLSNRDKFLLATIGEKICFRSDFGISIGQELYDLRDLASGESEDWWTGTDNSAIQPPQIKKSRLSVAEPPNPAFFEVDQAYRKYALRAAMVGWLALRINAYGLGPQEEWALQKLGGSPEIFRRFVKERASEHLPKPLFPNLLSKKEFIIEEIERSIDFSSCFDGMTTPEIEKMLSDVPPETRTKIIKQVKARHARMMEGPAATGERRIISGTAVWANNFREHLSGLTLLNHLDLSNLSLEGADLSSKKMTGCRFEGSNLTGALFKDTDLRFTRFGTADLTGARFNKNSDLREADLSEANLSGLGSRFFDQSNAKVFAPLAVIDAPRYDSTTRFLPQSWDKPWHRPTPEEKELQKKRFEGWTPEQVEFVARKVGVLPRTQRAALNKLAQLLREDAKNNLILSSRNQGASAHELLPETVFGGINEQEIDTAISRHQAYVDSAGLPLLKGNHDKKDLTHHDLRGGFIVGASLINALMPERDLEGICINNSNLSGINLRDANLTDAILVNVDLSGADLRGVNLTRTRFVNCKLDRVLLDGSTMLDTQMQQCTLSNVTIGEGVIDDLLVSQSVLENISFAGRLDGKGVFISGIGLADSLMINAQFSGFTTVNQIELLGSLFVGSGGPGILDEADIIVSPESEWRDQMIQVAFDPVLGDVTYELSADQDPQRPAMRKGLFDRPPTGQASLISVIEEHISWGGERHATVSRFDHLRDIGFQPNRLSAIGSSENPAKLILPSRALN